jgi:hypothetical protein
MPVESKMMTEIVNMILAMDSLFTDQSRNYLRNKVRVEDNTAGLMKVVGTKQSQSF